MTHPSAVSGAFGKPFPEQIAFFRQKLGNLVPTHAWDDIEAEAHDQAFMVAGAAKADLLTDLATAMDKAISQGRGIEEFRKDFKSIVATNGWTGWTGEGSIKGEAWRVKTIYRTNSYTSYAAGRHAQLLDGNFAYWIYRHGESKEPRPQHLSWNGVALEPGHAFWRTHYPPSDWGCSCYVVGASSARMVARLGGDLSKALPDNWRSIDLKTGQMVGIGKGWGYAPGASVAETVNALAKKIGSWDYRVAKAFMEEVPEKQRDAMATAYRNLPSTADDARRYAQRIWDQRETPEPGRTLGLLTRAQAEAIAADTPVKAHGFDFSLSPAEVAHVRDQHANDQGERQRRQRGVMPGDFAMLPDVLNQGTPRYVGISDGHKMPVFEIAVEIDGETYVTRWEAWKRRRTMTLLSFFIKLAKGT